MLYYTRGDNITEEIKSSKMGSQAFDIPVCAVTNSLGAPCDRYIAVKSYHRGRAVDGFF